MNPLSILWFVLALLCFVMSLNHYEPPPRTKIYYVVYMVQYENGGSGTGRTTLTITNPSDDDKMFPIMEECILKEGKWRDKPTKVVVTGLIRL